MKIIKKEVLSQVIKSFEIEAKDIAKNIKPGQFIVLRLDEKGERFPLTVAGTNLEKGTIKIIFQEAGKSTTQLGTLKEGDYLVVGTSYGKARRLTNEYNKVLKECLPSTPVSVIGLSEVPEAGDRFMAFSMESEAREIANKRKLIKESKSFSEVCDKANICKTTGNYETLKRIVKEKNIDITHFKRCGGNRTKIPIEELLKENTYYSSDRLKNRLLKEGYKSYKCECCKNTEWNKQPIPLELHHINGNHNDNRLENIQLLCPNCHALTDNYGGKNQEHKRKQSVSKIKIVINDEDFRMCYNEGKTRKELADIFHLTHQQVASVIRRLQLGKGKGRYKTPLKEDFEDMKNAMRQIKSYSGVAKLFGISDNAIKKRFIRHGYPNNIKELLEKLNV